ncbi:MAG: RNB domain-containing ribonuclease [Thiomargarita sp.]|nr:RNB domain-containing ribonuclease [Thiomargarita sp.]
MTEFEGQIWTAQDNDDIILLCTTKRIKNKIQAINEKGRDFRLSEDKLLWQYPKTISSPNDWQEQLTKIQSVVDKLYADIDIALLWEIALDLEISDIKELADLYFGEEITTEHLIAIWQVLSKDRLHFKRKLINWEPRTAEQIEKLNQQREQELARIKMQSLAQNWLKEISKNPIPPFLYLIALQKNEAINFPITAVSDELLPVIERLELWLQAKADKNIGDLITKTATTVKLSPRELVFEILQKIGRIPLDADRDVIVGGLKADFPTEINEFAQTVNYWQPSESQAVTELLFSIDDKETREIDDALAIEREADGTWKITIAIAEPASVIQQDDVLDKEAMRRGTTVYLPSQTILMLPEKISCDIASLNQEQVRSSLVIRVWVDEQGEIKQSSIKREAIKVLARLNYGDADKFIAQGQDEMAEQLRALLNCAKQFNAQRLLNGAFNLQRPEYKISVYKANIRVTMLNNNSPSRLLVAEMMILANHIAAKYAYENQIPIIYRTQDAPKEPITEEMTNDPLCFYKIRKLLERSSLSLENGGHSGLGLSMYTQLTSPLRRFADLVMQRQLMAHLVNESFPYDKEQLFKILETAERTSKASRSIENEAKKRYLLQYLKQVWSDQVLKVLVVNESKGGYKVEIQPWGLEAFLATADSLEVGSIAKAMIDKIRVKLGITRLKLAK